MLVPGALLYTLIVIGLIVILAKWTQRSIGNLLQHRVLAALCRCGLAKLAL
jgi:hypothetical protein